MASLPDLTEQLAAAVVGADTADLVTLAAVFDHLEAISRAATDTLADAENARSIKTLATGTASLVQKIVLNEVADANASLREVGNSTAELQRMVEEALAGKKVTAAALVATAKPHAAAATETVAGGIVETALNPDDRSLVIDFIEEANAHVDAAEAELLKLEEEPDNLETVNAIFRSFHTIKGVAGFLNLAQIGKLAHAAESLLDRAREGKLQLVDRSLDLVLESIDAMKRLLGMLDAAVKADAIMPVWPPVVGLIERLGQFVQGGGSTGPTASVAANIAELVKPQAADATVKVATDRLDALINHVGELVIAHSMVAQDVAGFTRDNQRLAGNMSHLGKIARELQELSMAMRMVPIAGVFQKMTRLVRDVSRKLGKEIELVVIGKETEVDRNVVEAIVDPLVHMIRNACDHGIETPDVRVKNGKPRHGRIELKASHQSGNIVIDITDNGNGLDTDRIMSKAIDAGIVGVQEQLTEAEIYKLVFAAGVEHG